MQEEDDVTRLERQALEDLGLLEITEESPVDTQGPPGNLQTRPRSVPTSRSAEIASDLFRSSFNPTSQTSSGSQYSRFSPVVRLATPSPMRQSSTNYHVALQNRSQQGTRTPSAIQFNSNPLHCHRDLPANIAPSVEANHTCDDFLRNPVNLQYSHVNQTQYVMPTPVKASYRSASQNTLGEGMGQVQTSSRQPCSRAASRMSPTDTGATRSQQNLCKEPYSRPVQVVSPTSKTQGFTRTPSDNRSLSLRSALAFNPRNLDRSTIEDSTAVSADASTPFRWEPNVSEVLSTAFRSTISGSRRIPKTLAQEALLDMEVSVYMTAGSGRLVTSSWSERPLNPLAKAFLEGDSRVSGKMITSRFSQL